MANKNSKFYKLVTSGKEALKQAQAAMAEKHLRHRFESAHLSAQEQIMALEAEREAIYASLAENPVAAIKTFNVNRLAQIRIEVDNLEAGVAAVEDEFTELFGGSLTRVSVETD